MSLSCYSPSKRRAASPKKQSARSPTKEKPYAALDETQRSHAFRYAIGNNFYRDQCDREKLAPAQRDHEAAMQTTDDTPSTTVTSFMAQMDAPMPAHVRMTERFEDLKLVPEGDDESFPTDRAWIERRSEDRLIRMIANTPASRALDTDMSEEDTPPYARRQLPQKAVIKGERKVSMPETNKSISSKTSASHSSPKKPGKLSFSIPGTKSTAFSSGENNIPVNHNVPIKAAKVLGTSNVAEMQGPTGASKWSFNLNRRKSQRSRSKSMSSVPDQQVETDDSDLTALPVLPGSNSAQPDLNVAFDNRGVHDAYLAPRQTQNRNRQLVREDSDGSLPPTPVPKDTPPHVKAAAAAVAAAAMREAECVPGGLGILAADKDRVKEERVDGFKGTAGLDEDQIGARLVKHGAAEYAELVRAPPSMYSMSASVVGSPTSPTGPRRQSVRADGLTLDGRLPRTSFISQQYSPSMYSAPYKTPEPTEREKTARPFKPTPALHPIAGSPTPTRSSFDSPVKRSSNRTANAENDQANEGSSAGGYNSFVKSSPIVYSTPDGELVYEEDSSEESESVQDLISRFPFPPRSSSLNWQKNPPPGARLSLIPPEYLKRSSSTQEPSLTTREHSTGPSATSNKMRNDSSHTTYDGAADEKPANRDTAGATDGTNGIHLNAHTRQDSANDGVHKRSTGLTPFLNQQWGDSSNVISPGFNHPSAMPSPLHGPFPTAPTMQPGVPSHEQLLTHFHVLHYHIEDTFRLLQDFFKNSQEEMMGESDAKVTDIRKTMDESFGDLRAHLNAIEHNMGRTVGEIEALKNTIDAQSRTIDDQLIKPVRKVTNQNTELIKKIESLQDHINKLERKLDDVARAKPPTYSSSGESGSGQGPSFAGRQSHEGPPAPFARPWAGYDAPRHLMGGQQQDRQSQYTDVSGRYYNSPNPGQQPTYQDYYGNGSSYDFMRYSAATNGNHDVDDDGRERKR